MANDDKLWTQPALYAIAKAAALDAIQSQGGLALPCKVMALNPTNPATGAALGYSFVQVEFQVTLPYTKPDGTAGTYTLPPLVLPKAEGQWVRSPTQVGDLGVTQAVDTSHGIVSGLSAGVPSVGTAYGNLSTLVFVPVGNTIFGDAPDPNKAWVNGPAGAVTSDTAQTATTVHATNTITHTAGVGTADQVKTIYDGAGNAISHVVSSGGLIGLGALASTIPSTGALFRNADVSTFQTSLLSARLNDQIALVNLLEQKGVMTSAQLTQVLLVLVAGFLPAIGVPAGSAITRTL